MRFKTIAFALIVLSAVCIFGCSETDRINEDMELSFEVTFDPPLDLK